MFKVGDVVCLKSGGPQMTVSDIVADGVYCQWFDGKTRHDDIVNPVTLDLWADYEDRWQQKIENWDEGRDDSSGHPKNARTRR
jgi:uncharacterized protein YodC (DUF2158 family)